MLADVGRRLVKSSKTSIVLMIRSNGLGTERRDAGRNNGVASVAADIPAQFVIE